MTTVEQSLPTRIGSPFEFVLSTNLYLHVSTTLHASLFCAFLWLIPCLSSAQSPGELIKNGGFEGGGGADGRGAGIPRWNALGLGYEVDRTAFHGGEQSARCDSLRTESVHGAEQEVTLNQTHAAPIVVSGWSKADSVSGVKSSDYALYIDLEYADGTPLWGQAALFGTGTHGWERRQVLITPAKPVRKMTVIGLFRKHTGTAWFDDFTANQMDGAGIFDCQPLLPLPARRASSDGRSYPVTGGDGLSLSLDAEGNIVGVKCGLQPVGSTAVGGFWVRDVAANIAPAAMRGKLTPRVPNGYTIEAASEPMQLRFTGRIIPEHDAIGIDGDVSDTSNKDRAVTVYFAVPVAADGWSWGTDIRRSIRIKPDQEQCNLTHVNVGATSGISLYPVGCVSNSENGIAIANQMEMPSVYRIFYNGPTRQLVIAWDFALTDKTNSWPKHQAHFHCTLFRLPPQSAAWGFRAAMQRFYALNFPDFNRLAKAEGIWAPFTAPESVKDYQDFGFAYHEGDNSKKADNAAGILDFRYTEPMTWWMPMPPAMPRTYENALKMVSDLAVKKETITPGMARPTLTELAKAVLNCGSQDEYGRYNLEFRNEPWGNGAVFVMNPNPEIAASAERPTRGYLNYNADMAKRLYGTEASRTQGVQDGEYLDSLESWSDVLDFRPENLAGSPYPLTFETDSRRTTLPQWFSTHTFTRYLRDDLHNRGKLLMANAVPIRYTVYTAILDVMGIEVNWLNGSGGYDPETDEVMSLRRTMSGTKPYLLLMNTDFDRFDNSMVERYFKTSMFYGIFPSMFSANAAEHPYWEAPKWYDRDRSLFKKYIPIIKKLSSAGWEPITYARSTNPDIYVERFGAHFLTIRNATGHDLTGAVTLDLGALKLPRAGLHVMDMTTGAEIKSSPSAGSLDISVSLKGGDAEALEIR
jgi:hypothetical protein